MTSRLKDVGNRFKSVFQTIDGMRFYGQLLGLPDTSRVSNFLSARRYLRTNPTTPIRPGNVIIADGVKFIVAEHGEGFYNVPIYIHFKLFDVDSILPLYETVTTKDPITGVKKTTPSASSTKNIYLSTQPAPNKIDEINIPQQYIICVANDEAHVGDRVGDYIVTKSDKMLGIWVLEMKKI